MAFDPADPYCLWRATTIYVMLFSFLRNLFFSLSFFFLLLLTFVSYWTRRFHDRPVYGGAVMKLASPSLSLVFFFFFFDCIFLNSSRQYLERRYSTFVIIHFLNSNRQYLERRHSMFVIIQWTLQLQEYRNSFQKLRGTIFFNSIRFVRWD